MKIHQEMIIDGSEVRITRTGSIETFQFASGQEAKARVEIIQEALSWCGTPFVNCGDVKGPNGAIDCAMLLVRCYVDTGRLVGFDPRPYPPQWHLHNGEERFLGWIVDRLGALEIKTPRLGDVLVYKWGRCYAHGAILINSEEIVHAYSKSRMCHVSKLTESDLARTANNEPRPVKFFGVLR